MTTPPCSESERAAAERVALRLGEAGFAVEPESFATRSSADPWRAAYAALSALAALALYAFPLVAVLAGVIAVVLHARDSDGRPLLTPRSCSSVNVVARAAEASRPGLVVVAAIRPRTARFSADATRALTLSLQTLMTAVPAAGAIVWVAEVDARVPTSVATGGAIAAALVAALALALALYRPPAPGDAADGSAAVDVLVDLAPLLRDRRVWLVVTGAPEAGTAGMEALLDDRPEDVAGAAWLNLVPAEGTDVVAVSEEGTWRERRADRWLLGTAEEAGADVRPFRVAPTDATPLLARRRRALTLMVPRGPKAIAVALATVGAALDEART